MAKFVETLAQKFCFKEKVLGSSEENKIANGKFLAWVKI